MTHAKDTAGPLQYSLGKRMLIGASIGLIAIGIFVFGVSNPPAAWGSYWRIKPLLFGPFAGAMGGLCNYYIMRYHKFFEMPRWMAFGISLVVFVVGMWMGMVLGLNGTMWD